LACEIPGIGPSPILPYPRRLPCPSSADHLRLAPPCFTHLALCCSVQPCPVLARPVLPGSARPRPTPSRLASRGSPCPARPSPVRHRLDLCLDPPDPSTCSFNLPLQIPASFSACFLLFSCFLKKGQAEKQKKSRKKTEKLAVLFWVHDQKTFCKFFGLPPASFSDFPLQVFCFFSASLLLVFCLFSALVLLVFCCFSVCFVYIFC
jgi:hypothetical protein